MFFVVFVRLVIIIMLFVKANDRDNLDALEATAAWGRMKNGQPNKQATHCQQQQPRPAMKEFRALSWRLLAQRCQPTSHTWTQRTIMYNSTTTTTTTTTNIFTIVTVSIAL
jgi:hypothetical protein